MLSTAELTKIVLDSLKSITPEEIISRNQSLKNFLGDSSGYYLLAFGKGSSYFAQSILRAFPKMTRGVCLDITKPEQFDNKIEILIGDHPLPSERNIENTRQVIKFINQIPQNAEMVTVICGGTSALFTNPVNSLSETEDLVNKMLRASLSINQINIVRKHIDEVKGGQLAKLLNPRPSLNLYVSDVPDNDLSVIGSGPTVLDPTTISEATKIASAFHFNGKLIETPKDNSIFDSMENEVIISIKDLLDNFQGYFNDSIHRDDQFLAKDQDRVIAEIKELTKKPEQTFILGGESQLKITASGQGGRCSHLALRILSEVEGNFTIASIATDGHDNSNAAGVIFNTNDLKTKIDQKAIDQSLNDFDSYNFFRNTNSLLLTGPLSVNLSDLLIISR